MAVFLNDVDDVLVLSAKCVSVCRVFRRFKRYGNMTLGCQIVTSIGLHLLDNTDKICGIRQIAIMENKVSFLFMGVLVKMINPSICNESMPICRWEKH